MSVPDAREAVKATLAVIADELAAGGAVALAGFGKFSVSHRAARQGRNPSTGETIGITASRGPKFSAASALKKRLNGEERRAFADPPPARPRRPRGSQPLKSPAPAGEREDTAVDAPSARTAAERRLTRTPHLDVSPRTPLAPGSEFDVLVYAATDGPHAGEESEQIDIRTPAGVSRVELSVWLTTSSHFERAEDQRIKKMVIIADAERTEAVAFHMRVAPAGHGKGTPWIRALFTHDARGAGMVTREVRVRGVAAPRRKAPKRPPDALDATIQAQDVDLRIHINAASDDERTYTCTIFSALDKDGASEEWCLPARPQRIVSEYLEQFAEAGASAAQRANRLRTAGRRLFCVSPEIFRRTYWELVDTGRQPRTIAIESDEPHIPWELMIPMRDCSRNSDEPLGHPLGVRHTVGRWTHPGHVAAPQHIVLDDAGVVVPYYKGRPNLKHAPLEAEFVRELFEGRDIDPATWLGLNRVFEGVSPPLFHFICHGADDGDGIVLAAEEGKRQNSTLRSLDIEGWDVARRALGRHPTLVFINACDAARTALTLFGLDGLAAGFAALGAAAVLAPLWNVDDEEAGSVAEEVYKVLESGPASIATTLQKIRCRAYDGTASDTHAAYCFFGDPRAIVEIRKRLGDGAPPQTR